MFVDNLSSAAGLSLTWDWITFGLVAAMFFLALVCGYGRKQIVLKINTLTSFIITVIELNYTMSLWCHSCKVEWAINESFFISFLAIYLEKRPRAQFCPKTFTYYLNTKFIAKCQKKNNLKYVVLPNTFSTEIWYGGTRGCRTFLSWTCVRKKIIVYVENFKMLSQKWYNQNCILNLCIAHSYCNYALNVPILLCDDSYSSPSDLLYK